MGSVLDVVNLIHGLKKEIRETIQEEIQTAFERFFEEEGSEEWEDEPPKRRKVEKSNSIAGQDDAEDDMAGDC
jgi:hypothetical protein